MWTNKGLGGRARGIEEEEFLRRCEEGKFRVVPKIEWVVAVEQTEKWADWYIYYLSEDIPKVCPKMFKTCFVYHKESMMYREKYNKMTSRWESEMFSSFSFKYWLVFPFMWTNFFLLNCVPFCQLPCFQWLLSFFLVAASFVVFFLYFIYEVKGNKRVRIEVNLYWTV